MMCDYWCYEDDQTPWSERCMHWEGCEGCMECWYDGYDEYSYAEHVVCPGNEEYEYCDCRSDCGAYFEGTYQGYCECSEAQADDCCGSWTGEYYHGGYPPWYGDPYWHGDWYGQLPRPFLDKKDGISFFLKTIMEMQLLFATK